MGRQNTISLCMIVKNEEQVLERCLKSVQDIVNEIVIVDTGSTDHTKDIAGKYGAKIYDFTWNNDFSAARNHALEKATGDWLLLLDADEELNPADKDKLLLLIRNEDFDGYTFTVHNYLSQNKSEYSIHKAFRLLRNNGKYHFTGAVHEQITAKDERNSNRLTASEIVIFHYGYMENIILDKKKQERNLFILLKQIEEDPENSFTLFNLGNEYMSMGNIKEALSVYEKAYAHMNRTQAYAPHLYYRLIVCLNELKQFDRAIQFADEALQIYPRCTDIQYCKGLVYVAKDAPLQAVACLRRCIEMGEPPSSLRFLNGCENLRPYLALGEIYMLHEDYDKAIECFTQVINTDGTQYRVLYQLGHAYARKYTDPVSTAAALAHYFSNMEYAPNAIVYGDILVHEKLYAHAQTLLQHFSDNTDYPIDFEFLRSKLLFFTRRYEDARHGFLSIVESEEKGSILPNPKKESIRFLGAIAMLEADSGECMETLRKADDFIYRVHEKLSAVIQNWEAAAFDEADDPHACMEVIMSYLEKILQCGEFDLFERSLPILNLVNTQEVLLPLAQIYHKFGYKEMAVRTIMKSVVELNTIDSASAFLLWKDLPGIRLN